MQRTLISICLSGGLLFAPLTTHAGDLNPPPGPIQATNRVILNEQSVTLPYTITESGSYVLTSNLTGVAGQSGIIISANDVTVDLNGFSLIGVPGSRDGINAEVTTAERVTIHNGIIRDWGRRGIDSSAVPVGLDTLLSYDWIVDDVQAINNSGGGIVIPGRGQVQNCFAVDNGLWGIFSAGNVINCKVSNNEGTGIQILWGVVDGCASIGNGNAGISITRGMATRCTTTSNGDAGYIVFFGAVESCNSASDENGIRAFKSGRVTNNHVVDAVQTGIIAQGGQGAIVMKNTVSNSGVSDYIIGVGNTAGPIVDVASITDISTIPGSSHPWANFIH